MSRSFRSLSPNRGAHSCRMWWPPGVPKARQLPKTSGSGAVTGACKWPQPNWAPAPCEAREGKHQSKTTVQGAGNLSFRGNGNSQNSSTKRLWTTSVYGIRCRLLIHSCIFISYILHSFKHKKSVVQVLLSVSTEMWGCPCHVTFCEGETRKKGIID